MYSQSSIPPFVYLIPAFFSPVRIPLNSQHSSMAFFFGVGRRFLHGGSRNNALLVNSYNASMQRFVLFEETYGEYGVRDICGRTGFSGAAERESDVLME